VLPAHDRPLRDRTCAAPASREIFGDAWAALSDAQLLKHFAAPRAVRLPALSAPTPEQLRNADEVLAHRFRLVGETHALRPGFSWRDNPSRDKEWQIAHHKFYFAVDLVQAWLASGDVRYLHGWRRLIDSWLREMDSGFIATSDAQVEAKRIEHWVLSFHLLQGSDWARHVPGTFLRAFLGRIASETRYIARNLRPARNHRTFQLYAMVLVGISFPELRDCTELIETGRSLLTENLLKDFAPDGVHVELSTHYHQITLETALAFFELARLNGVTLAPELGERLRRALEFSLHIAWPDGRMPLINDSDDGEHLPMLHQGARLFGDERLLWAASGGRAGEAPKAVSRHFDHCGYFTLSDTWGSDAESYARRQHVFYDCGRLGEGSHSHYDLFNFCYYVGGEPLVVDPGRYTYDAEPGAEGIDWRREFKSTRSHNTVTVDGLDQTRYLSKARHPPAGVERYNRSIHPAKHGPDAQAVGVEYALGEITDWIRGSALSHEYSPLHTRVLVFMARQYLFIYDHVRIDDRREHEAALHFHLDARWRDRVALGGSAGEIIALGPDWQIRSLKSPGLGATLGSGWVSTRYGVKEAAPVLRLVRSGARALTFATLLVHRRAVAGGLALKHFCRIGDAGNAFEVAGCAAGKAFVDRFVVQTDVMAGYRDDMVEYRGAFLAYRRGAAGGFEFLSAASPEALAVEREPCVRRDMRGHVEWRSLGGGGR
jgi:hypothetical protein